MDKILPIEILEESVIKINEMSNVNLEELARQLVKMGYERLGQVERPGNLP